MKKAVVTGGAGFIGSHLAESLLREGTKVLIIDDLSTGQQKNVDEIARLTGNTPEFLRADLNDDAAFDAICDFQPEILFHVAAQANVRLSVEKPAFDATTNILGTIRLLQASEKAKVKGFIFSSTGGAIYGEQLSFPATEDHRTAPECPYGVSKRAAELYIEYYARVAGFAGIALRYGNVFGPRQNPKGEAGVVAIFTDRLMKGQELVVNGDGEQTRDFIYVGDVVSANVLAAKAVLSSKLKLDRNFSVFNVGRGKEASVNDVARAIQTAWRETAPRGEEVAPTRVVNGPSLPGEQRRSVIDNSKIARELGWKSQMGFEEGLVETVRSFR
ncbi:MAG: SDR family NAD(P)-dependent oxidoreductase [Bdellovibrionota bacterium]